MEREPVEAKGWRVGQKGKEYLDIYGGHAVISVGTTSQYVDSICKQAAK